MQPIIKIENLSKMYRLGVIGTGTISHDLNRWWHKVRGKEDPYLKIGEANVSSDKSSSGYVWALKDINLEIMPGEVLGIIGKNGAGKSTLLKILSKVTGPTTGSIKYKGRIGSLLEVGTGFHKELTGRENIFLNGAILGMTKAEIRNKLDEIVDFAGVERYIDTPVKRYSSGMMVRLGFAVAAHLEPEILVVDEVLAVGDAEFQKKAIGKMQDVSNNDGRTVLFVSHNMQSVSTLTNKCAVLNNGSISFYGDTNSAINYYLKENIKLGTYEYHNSNPSTPFVKRVIVKTSIEGGIQEVGKKMSIEFIISFPFGIKSAAFSYQIVNSLGIPVVHVLILNEEKSFGMKTGEYKLTSIIPKLRLYPDFYSITTYLADNFSKEKYTAPKQICRFEVKVLNQLRDRYWNKGNAIYIEDNSWDAKKYE